jgi:hypothetical protein
MTLPGEVTRTIEKAKVQLSKSPYGHLLLPIRREILASIGPSLELGTPDAHKAHNRRTTLAMMCIQQVLPLWKNMYPGNDGPERMLSLAGQLLRNEINPGKAKKEKGDFWSDLDSFVYTPENNAILIGYGAASVVTVALVDEIVEKISDDSIDDDDEDPYQWSVSFFALLAYSNAETGRNNVNVEKKLEYWTWYLTKAVPTAYEAVI